MAISSLTAGNDAILDSFTDYWDANSAAATEGGQVPVLLYEDTDVGVPDDGSPWAEVIIRNNTSRQATLSGDTDGTKYFRDFGIVVVAIRAPSLKGRREADALAQVAKNAFEGKTAGPSNEIWFRNVRINEFGQENNWYRIDMLAEFEYDRVK